MPGHWGIHPGETGNVEGLVVAFPNDCVPAEQKCAECAAEVGEKRELGTEDGAGIHSRKSDFDGGWID